MSEVFIPAATAAKLAEFHPVGTRHHAAMSIAISLVGNGLPPAAVFATLREKFPPPCPDSELQGIVNYAVNANPTPSGYGQRNGFTPSPAYTAPPAPEKKRTPTEHAAWWLNNVTLTPDKFAAKSQIAPPESGKAALTLALELLYNGPDNLNIVCAFDKADDSEKTRPKGPGRIFTRDKWLEYIADKGVPTAEAGAWFRPNPVNATGTGAAGAITDSDVAAFRFLLVESDVLPLDQQLALFDRLALPFSAVVMSGGLSAHGWLRIDAKNGDEFSELSRRILAILQPFGIDQANKNPSRLSRLPGATRKHGGIAGGAQRLLQLNPGKPALKKEDIDALENRLLLPAIEEKPFARLCDEALTRYDDLVANKGKLGVPTGFQKFDSVSGGLKPGGYTLIAANTGAGKTTIALNIINAALEASVGVVLFSLEMPREDMVDMIFSLRCRVNRNAFNTGEFTEGDMKSMFVALPSMRNLPLWIDDDPANTIDKIRRRVLALKADGRIGLVVIDYAQLAAQEQRGSNREQDVAAVALGIRLLARESMLPVVVLSQLNDDGKIRESRKLTHEAVTVLKLERENNDLTSRFATLFVAKGRKIPANPIALEFDAAHCRISERTGIDDSDVPKQSKRPYKE